MRAPVVASAQRGMQCDRTETTPGQRRQRGAKEGFQSHISLARLFLIRSPHSRPMVKTVKQLRLAQWRLVCSSLGQLEFFQS